MELDKRTIVIRDQVLSYWFYSFVLIWTSIISDLVYKRRILVLRTMPRLDKDTIVAGYFAVTPQPDET